MSSSHQHVDEIRRPASIMSDRAKASGRALLAPVVNFAKAVGLTPNTITVLGLAITVVASVLIASGMLLVGAALLTAGSLLDAVDGALARAQGAGTPFGAFLDSTLDRSGEAIVFIGIGTWLLSTQPNPTGPMVALMVALAGSFLVSYSHARAQGIGAAADVGLAPRTERLVAIIAGIVLAGIGFVPGLIGILVILAVLTVITVIQRIWHVWRLSQAAHPANKEN